VVNETLAGQRNVSVKRAVRTQRRFPVEPLLPIEKKLIGCSLGIGLLVLLMAASHFVPVML